MKIKLQNESTLQWKIPDKKLVIVTGISPIPCKVSFVPEKYIK